MSDSAPRDELHPVKTTNSIKTIQASLDETPVADGTWYQVTERGAKLQYEFDQRQTESTDHIHIDIYLDASTIARFNLRFMADNQETEFVFRLLPKCEARLRIPLRRLESKKGLYPREGAVFKIIADDTIIDPANLNKLELCVAQLPPDDVRLCLTPVRVTPSAPPKLVSPTLPEGPLLDKLGQSLIRTWDEKTDDVPEIRNRLQQQISKAEDGERKTCASESNSSKVRFDGTGFFDTAHDGERWWFVDPDGRRFWSTGVNVVRPVVEAVYDDLESAIISRPDPNGPFADAYIDADDKSAINHLALNFMRIFGPSKWKRRWESIVLSEISDLGFNTIGNWSEWEVAKRADVPFVRSLDLDFTTTLTVFRDFPDVFDSAFQKECRQLASTLESTVEMSTMVGYFLGNEPQWSFTDDPPAAGMLYETETCATRERFAAFLRDRYGGDKALANAWGMDVALSDITHGKWEQSLSKKATHDAATFSRRLVNRFCSTLSEACDEVDPNHLNLGLRYPGAPPEWALESLTHFDVFTVNIYESRLPSTVVDIGAFLDLPILVGEFHSGALDVGLPSPGLYHVASQADRGRAYRRYVEDAAANPQCIGCHFFSLYDESALGRFDGESFNCGLYDVCHRRYEPLTAAVSETNARVHHIAAGDVEPVDPNVEELPDLY